MTDESSDEDYDAFGEGRHLVEKKYPVHDCCEYEDIEALRTLLFIKIDDDEDDDDDDDDEKSEKMKDEDSSSDDENDSIAARREEAAARQAAIGHSPQPLKSAEDAEDPDSAEAGTPGESEGVTGLPDSVAAQENDIPVSTPNNSESNLKDDTVEKEAEPTVDTADSVPAENEAEKGIVSQEKPTPMDVDTDAKQVDGDAPTGSTSNGGGAKHAVSPETHPQPKKTVVNPDIHLSERDDDENTPLHIAIHARKLEHVKLLLEAGASLRMKCDGSWPVHTAISLGAIRKHKQFAYECVVALHEHDADLTMKDDSLHTPLFLACMFNLPEIAQYILSDEAGLTTLNTRADRVGNRPLHAASKFDTLDNPSFSKGALAIATGQHASNHHPDGTVVPAMHAIPGFPGKLESSSLLAASSPPPPDQAVAPAPAMSEAFLTQLLLATPGIEIDAVNALGHTPLHVACLRGNWPVARLLLQAGASPEVEDRRGYLPGQLSYKRGMPIPNDLIETLGGPPETGIVPPTRDLIVDPHGSTLLLSHELCALHRTCPPMRRDSSEPPPENVRRLHVIVDDDTGILRSGEYASLAWQGEARRAAVADVLKVHDYNYVEAISQASARIPDHPNAVAHLDPDTAISRWSFEAALRAAGSVCQAVDRVVAGDHRNAFCAVRPPGHHAGPRGLVRCANDPDGGSHGFCLFNNVAIGAAYARSMYRNDGIHKVAIIDFDVHHGNGTEAIIRQLVPSTEQAQIRTPFAQGEISTNCYRPWLDETDIQNVFFASTHGYGRRGFEQPGFFYPGSGKSLTAEAITRPAMIESPNLTDFLLSQTWARMGDDSKDNCCKIINVGLELPEPDTDPQARSMKQRMDLRDTFRSKIFPHLREFDPDLIFISAGFDAHRKDTMNFGYVGMVEEDYEWVTENLIKIANTCCNGRVVSVLEGGYKIHGGIVSPFARSVGSHVRALVDGSRSRELYDPRDGEWESQFEHQLYQKRERKKEQEREQLRQFEMASRRSMNVHIPDEGAPPDDPDAPSRKRRRHQVDYKELFKQMQQEGFAG